MNYSVTQGANIAGFAAAVSIVIRLVTSRDFASLSEAEITTVITALVSAGAAAVSYVQRYRKGDVTPVGFRK